MSAASRQPTPAFLRIMANTLATWEARTANLPPNALETLLDDAPHLYRALDFGLQHEATWEQAAKIICQTRLFASRLGQQQGWLQLLQTALRWCQQLERLRAELLLVQGQLQRDLRDLNAASDSFTEAEPLVYAQTDPVLTVRLQYNQAETALKNNQLARAESLCQQAKSLLIKFPEAKDWQPALLHIMGDTYREKRELEQAKQLLSEAATLLENRGNDTIAYVRVLNTLAVTLQMQQAYDQAQVVYEKGLGIVAGTPYVSDVLLIYINLSTLFMARQAWQEAELILTKANLKTQTIPVSPNTQAKLLNNLGYLYFQQKQHKEAVYFFNESIKIKRTLEQTLSLANSLGNLGHALLAQGRKEAAKAAYDEALTLIKPQLHLARAQELQQEFGEKRQELQ